MRQAAIIFLAALLSLSPLQVSRAEWSQYGPVLRIGSGTGWKNILLIFWSHQNSRSAWVQQDILQKLMQQIGNKDLTVMMYQIAGPEELDLSEASIFLCVPKENYGIIIARYLYLLADEKTGYSPSTFVRLIPKAGAGLGLPKKLSECWAGRPGYERATALNVYRNALKRNWPFDSLPVFLLNGRRIDVQNVDDIRARLFKQ